MFFPISDPQKSWKSKVFENPSKPLPLGPCPDDRAQNSVQDSINESSVRPNPTLVFAKILFQFCHFWPPPSTAPKKYKNPPLTNPLENPDPWDHAQTIEREILFRIALTRALYDQMAPQLCLFYISAKFDFRPTAPMPLKLCPSCRSRKKLQNSGIETSVRPNPTLVFSFWSCDPLC